ncbi:SRPBCC family protein [Mycobacterium sp. 663a-19]|uniref:SRPBCC family protein n=1 Tax=Mycobacterium sp. 663a-19 TaxID=2986148 RepID=UPI002D1F5DF5|nr:SRPBCC family protein [Mycobacterium sp. 663a-19]MEB3981558.1 SRPBCC family protein [Mycobacterium sp. 663a-19]
MGNMKKRTAQAAMLLAMLYGARRYYRNWGTTKAECRMPLPGDDLVADPAIQTTEAVYIDAPISAVWPWLLQMGQERGGFYGCEGLKNLAGLNHHDADRIHPEWQRLEVGDGVRLAPAGWMGLPDGVTLTVAEVVPEKYIVLNATRPDQRWNAVWSFHLQPHWEDRVRLLTRARIALRHPGEVFLMELVRPVIALGTRGLLLGIKHRVERPVTPSPNRNRNTAASLSEGL